MGEIIVVTSGKDGVGKTVIAANLGVSLAQKGKSVVLLDMNIGSRNLDIRMGIENNIVYDIADILSGVCRIKKAMVKDKRFDKLFIISAPQNKDKMNISNVHVNALCEELKKVFDYIIIDAPSGSGIGFEQAISPADKAVIVVIPEYAAIRDAELINTALKNAGIQDRSVIINKILPQLHSTEFVPDPDEIAQALRLSISGLIPYDQNIHISANMGIPIAAFGGNYISDNLKRIAERIII